MISQPAAPALAGGRIATVVELAPVAFAVIAEAAWIAVLGGLLQGFGLHDPVLGVPILAAFVTIGIVAARLIGPRLEHSWPSVALVIVTLGAIAGVLLAADARTASGRGLGPVLAAHPGGLVAGLAVLRGYAHARLPLEEGTVTRLLAIGIPGLAVMALIGGGVAEPFRDRFLADALGGSIVFVAATVLALAFARLGVVGADGGFDWRGNPAWLGLTVVLLVVAIVAAIPLSAVAGSAISILLSVALGPLLLLGIATGFDRTGRRLLAFFIAVVAVLFILTRVFGGTDGPLPSGAAGGSSVPPPSPAQDVVVMSLGGIVLLGLVVGALILIALWMRRTFPPTDLVDEERIIDADGEALLPGRPRRRFRRRPDPAGAAAAYVALVDDLDGHPDVRRQPAETPAEHAARLRSIGRSDLSLHLLAADYALARYGGETLPAREDRRAVGRWRMLRRRLATPPTGWIPPITETSGAGPRPNGASPEDVAVRRTL